MRRPTRCLHRSPAPSAGPTTTRADPRSEGDPCPAAGTTGRWRLLCLIVIVVAITSIGSSSAELGGDAADRDRRARRRAVDRLGQRQPRSRPAGRTQLRCLRRSHRDRRRSRPEGEQGRRAGADRLQLGASFAGRPPKPSSPKPKKPSKRRAKAKKSPAAYDSGATTVLASYEPDSTAGRAPPKGPKQPPNPRPRDKEEAKGRVGNRRRPSPPRPKKERASRPGGRAARTRSPNRARKTKTMGRRSASATPSAERRSGAERPGIQLARSATVSVATAEAKLRQARAERRERRAGSPRNRPAGSDLRHDRLRLGLGRGNRQRRRLGGRGRLGRRIRGRRRSAASGRPGASSSERLRRLGFLLGVHRPQPAGPAEDGGLLQRVRHRQGQGRPAGDRRGQLDGRDRTGRPGDEGRRAAERRLQRRRRRIPGDDHPDAEREGGAGGNVGERRSRRRTGRATRSASPAKRSPPGPAAAASPCSTTAGKSSATSPPG